MDRRLLQGNYSMPDTAGEAARAQYQQTLPTPLQQPLQAPCSSSRAYLQYPGHQIQGGQDTGVGYSRYPRQQTQGEQDTRGRSNNQYPTAQHTQGGADTGFGYSRYPRHQTHQGGQRGGLKDGFASPTYHLSNQKVPQRGNTLQNVHSQQQLQHVQHRQGDQQYRTNLVLDFEVLQVRKLYTV